MALSEEFLRVKRMLIKHEGLRLKPYTDTEGKLTIGVGRNLVDNGISELEAMIMLSNDVKRVYNEATLAFPWFNSLSVIRQDAIASMVFNMGLGKVLLFRRMCLALQNGAYETAAKEMLDSKWAKQVGQRAHDLAYMIRNDSYPPGF